MSTFNNNTHMDDNGSELGQEFQKLAQLVPNIPKDECLSELEFIESVIAYIRELQQQLSHDQWSECLNKLASSMKSSFLSSPPSYSSSSSSASHPTDLLTELGLRSPRTSMNEGISNIRRSPLATLHLDNTRFSWTVSSLSTCMCLFSCSSLSSIYLDTRFVFVSIRNAEEQK